jgi:haloacetate dehalogenase
MFETFSTFDHRCNGVNIHGVTSGKGPPLLLLHGYPQTHAMWHLTAPVLSETFTVVAADLRGYGASEKPVSSPDHATYSKREMAKDMVDLMAQFGHDEFHVLAHDRGGRVAHRMAMDHPDRVKSMMILDIAPTREMYANTTDGFARDYWHWFYLIQDAPMPEAMIGADPDAYWLAKCPDNVFAEDALSAYLAAFRDPACISASCEDYRAAATIDIQHDNDDGEAKVRCPMHVLWGAKGVIEARFDCLNLWWSRAERVTGHALECGHYMAEELPDQIIAEALKFFGPLE